VDSGTLNTYFASVHVITIDGSVSADGGVSTDARVFIPPDTIKSCRAAEEEAKNRDLGYENLWYKLKGLAHRANTLGRLCGVVFSDERVHGLDLP
jgi:hypothetical protein